MNNPPTHIVISTATDLLRVPYKHILYISSDGNYSTLFLTGGEMRLVSLQLGQIEKLIAEQLSEKSQLFVRIGKSLIINANYIFYIHIAKQQLVLADSSLNRYTLSASKEALKALKTLVEAGI